ncbi:MAG TPA: class I SAM-dependent methyltransferase [Solirubrobacteraceae bacterium]|nr:class I SAM-dependent methyltransferase [Solirubrobacteraceae bacterium]
MSNQDLEHEWDALAELRLSQLASHLDVSYDHVIVPSLLGMLGDVEGGSVLDVGCGLGSATAQIAQSAASVVGVDLSPRQISLAREHHAAPNVRYLCGRLEDLVDDLPRASFDAVAANMTLMDVLDLDGFLTSATTALKPWGRLAFTITHPCFWPRYWGYDSAPWFDYSQEIAIRAPFQISLNRSSKLETTHVHRPLSTYVRSAQRAGLRLACLTEPMPDEQTAARYPSPWLFPRYIAGWFTRVPAAVSDTDLSA